MSSGIPDPTAHPPAHVRADGVAIDDEGRIASDLPCWSCAYNLRTIAPDADCPECGMPIAMTFEHRDGRKARPFSLHTIHPASRIVGILFGMLGPLLIVVSAATTPMDPMNVDWQSGYIEDYIGVMLAGRAMWAFYPFLFWAYAAYSAVMIAPITMGRTWWTRAGLWLGCVLGVQYQLIIFGNLFGLGEGFWIAIFISLIPLGILAAIVSSNHALDARRTPRPRKRRTWRALSIQAGVALFLLIVVGVLTRGIVFAVLLLPVLLAGPYLMLLCMSATLCRVYRTDFSEPPQRSEPIPVAAAAGGYLAAWPIAISQAQIVYSSLPMHDPSCYICTASAQGHRWLTRARPVRLADGSVMLVTKQMRILKAAEWLIAERLPRLHRAMRWVYDRVGPRIASRIQSCWLADVSYLLFVPVVAVAWLVLSILGRARQIEKIYRS